MTHGACAPGVPRRPLHTDVLGCAAAARILNKVVRSVANMTLAMARERTAKKGSTDGRNDVNSWSAAPSGDAFQYQYQLSLNGKSDTIEIWQNTVAEDINFSPLFRDGSEVRIFSQRYDRANGSTGNTTPLARSFPAGDGSRFGNDTDYFLDFAFPVPVMIANGLIATAADLDQSVYFAATSADPNNYNKSHLNCPFLPGTDLSVSVMATPDTVPVNLTTPVAFTSTVHNDGPGIAKGVVIDNSTFPSFLHNVTVTVTSDDPSATPTVVSSNPLEVRLPYLPSGA